MMEKTEVRPQKILFDSGNELAAYAAKQINYHVMGYYPITPSTQIAENLDAMKAEGLHDISLVAAEGEHSAAGICYGASVCGGRVFNQCQRPFICFGTASRPVGDPFSHGDECGLSDHFRSPFDQRGP